MTGSTEAKHIEFGIPVDWEEMTETDLREIRQKVEIEIEEEDFQSFDDICKLKGFQLLMGNSPVTKIVQAAGALGETATGAGAMSSNDRVSEERRALAEQIENLKVNVQPTIMKFSEQIISLKVLRTKAEHVSDADMLVPFVKAANAAVSKTERASKLLEKMLTNEVVDAEVPKLLILIEEITNKYGSLQDWATKFGIDGDGARSTRRRK